VGPFHGSNAFLTAHAAFTLEVEQALQAVDSSISAPYWDFTQDAEAWGDHWASSELFGYTKKSAPPAERPEYPREPPYT
jgi:hypothetical protein